MISKKNATELVLTAMLLLALVSTYTACNKDNPTLAPFDPGIVTLGDLSVEDSVYNPRVSWVGGYVSAFGVNVGKEAKLDSTLVWLVHQSGDGLHYQQRIGQLPAGAEDLTSSFGGHSTNTLQEDHEYTFWVVKENVWNVISTKPGKVLLADPNAASAVRETPDTLFLTTQAYLARPDTIDLFIGIRNVRSVGQLGVINIVQTNTDNAPIITFHITQRADSLPSPNDTMLAEIGICAGQAYDVGSRVWDILAVDTSSGQPQYWTRDVITSPLVAGQTVPGTQAFAEFPATGLSRPGVYYIWIANKKWDQVHRLRNIYNYASATFETY